MDFSKPSSEIESRRIKKGETAPGNTRGRFTTRRYTKLRLVLMVADARFKLMQPARATLALVLQPVQRLLLVPVDAWENTGDYMRGTKRARLG